MIEYLDETIRPLALKMPKMSGYVNTFKVKERHKLTSFRIDDKKLLEKYKADSRFKKYYIKCFTSLWWQIYKN